MIVFVLKCSLHALSCWHHMGQTQSGSSGLNPLDYCEKGHSKACANAESHLPNVKKTFQNSQQKYNWSQITNIAETVYWSIVYWEIIWYRNRKIKCQIICALYDFAWRNFHLDDLTPNPFVRGHQRGHLTLWLNGTEVLLLKYCTQVRFYTL